MNPITRENDRLGFVGIGYMGRPIARRLLESGFKLTAFDRDHSKAEELIQYGGKVAQSVSELSSSCNVVLSCLPSDQAVLDIYRGPGDAFVNAHRGSLLIDLSTVYPETSQELSRPGSEHAVEVLDVTISGSTPAAEKGLLTLFGGVSVNGLPCRSRSEDSETIIGGGGYLGRKLQLTVGLYRPSQRIRSSLKSNDYVNEFTGRTLAGGFD